MVYRVLDGIRGTGWCTGYWVVYRVLDGIPGTGWCTGYWIKTVLVGPFSLIAARVP